MHKSATKCNETLYKWCKNKHGASKIIDTFETYQLAPYCFQLACGARTYNGSTKPEDWLEDYSTAVNIAEGNLRWAVRYVPQMLEGPARIWLNNLPVGSINGRLILKSSLCQTSPVLTRDPTASSS
jgi:hypothetical protein